ncbi:MAG: hypothetical protein U0936_08500 [Planctomycetaceae bacterium]
MADLLVMLEEVDLVIVVTVILNEVQQVLDEQIRIDRTILTEVSTVIRTMFVISSQMSLKLETSLKVKKGHRFDKVSYLMVTVGHVAVAVAVVVAERAQGT